MKTITLALLLLSRVALADAPPPAPLDCASGGHCIELPPEAPAPELPADAATPPPRVVLDLSEPDADAPGSEFPEISSKGAL
jgi:hypothetical protein